MLRFVRRTFLPTAVFASLSLLDQWDPGSGFLLRHGPLLTAVAIVPPAWHWYVMRSTRARVERAALAGATVAFLIPTLSFVLFGAWFSVTHSWSDLGLGAIADALGDLFIIGGALLIAAPAGAVIGILLALIQRHWLRDSPDAAEEPTPALNVVSTAMVAILASPLLAILGAALLQTPLSWLFPRKAVGFCAMLVVTWLAIPVAAALGVLLIRARPAPPPEARAAR